MVDVFSVKLNKNWRLTLYHFYDNFVPTDRFTMFSISVIGFGWENFARKKILRGSKNYNIYFHILGFNFTLSRRIYNVRWF